MTGEIAVIGAGNGGCAVAADLTLRGHAVRLHNRSPERLAPIVERGGIELQGVAGEGFARIEVITTDLEEAISGCETIIVTTPTSALEHYAPALAPIVSDDQVVWLNPGHTGGALYFACEVERLTGRTGLRLCETASLTYASRMQGPAAVRVFKVSTNLLFAAFPAGRTDALFDHVAALFPTIRKAGNVLQTGLENLNAVEHPPQILCNAGWLEHTRGDYYFYFEGTTPSVARVIAAVDRERLALAAAAGVPTRGFVDSFFELGFTSERARDSQDVYRAMQDSEPNRWIKGPASLDHRYVHEDVGWGLVPWIHLGRLLDVPTPAMSALASIASIVNERDYLSDGLTLERMGLAGCRDGGDLREYVRLGARG